MFYWNVVTFQVEDELFRLPQHPFMKSPVFRATFSLPRPSGTAEGETDDQPFKLEGVDKQAFGHFLQGMFLDPRVEPKTLGIDVWVSVLRLAGMWEFHEIRKFAVDVLDGIGLSAIDKVLYGEEFNATRWLSEGYEALVKDEATISNDDAARLGWKTAARLLRVRELLATTQLAFRHSKQAELAHPLLVSKLTNENRRSEMTRLIKQEFGKELDECSEAEGLILAV